MATIREVVFQTIDAISKEAAPKRRGNSELREFLQERSKDIKAALAAGWSASALAKRLKTAGLMTSVSGLRKEIILIGGVATRSRQKKRPTSKTPSIVTTSSPAPDPHRKTPTPAEKVPQHAVGQKKSPGIQTNDTVPSKPGKGKRSGSMPTSDAG
jgi:hypothetical protein